MLHRQRNVAQRRQEVDQETRGQGEAGHVHESIIIVKIDVIIGIQRRLADTIKGVEADRDHRGMVLLCRFLFNKKNRLIDRLTVL